MSAQGTAAKEQAENALSGTLKACLRSLKIIQT